MLRNFSWVQDHALAGCALPASAAAQEALWKHGIRVVVTLTEEEVLPQTKHPFVLYHLPVTDFGIPSIEQALRFVQIVNEHVDRAEPVVVHCFAGVGRTGTMLAVMRISDGEDAATAIRTIRQLRPPSIQGGGQEQFLYSFEDVWRSR